MTNQVSRSSSQKSATRIGRNALILTAALLMAILSGCNSFRSWNRYVSDALMVSYRDMVWAKRAYNLRFGNCNRPYSEHFESGFCAGYTSLCDGGDGSTPALPPEDYRGYEYQTADGAKCIKAWFEGYPEGVAAAQKDNAGTFHDVAVSRMLDQAIKAEETHAQLESAVKSVQQTREGVSEPNAVPPIQTGSVLNYHTPAPPVPSFATTMAPATPPIVSTGSGVPPIVSTGSGVPPIVTQGQARPPVIKANYKSMKSANQPLPMGRSSIKDELSFGVEK